MFNDLSQKCDGIAAIGRLKIEFVRVAERRAINCYLPEDAYGDGGFAQRSLLVHLNKCFRSDGGSVSWLTFILNSCNLSFCRIYKYIHI